MTPSRCKQVWENGGTVFMTTLHLIDPRVAEIAAGIGWDALWIDLEHSAKSTRELEMMCRAIRAGSLGSNALKPDVLARPGKGEFMRMARLLEAGAHGIMYPRCESAEEAAETVRWMKFAPLGERGFDGGNADNDYGAYPAGDYVEQANEHTWLAIQIESPAAVEQAPAIARVDGVDALFFGPGDYSCLIGKPARFMDAAVVEAAARVADAAHGAGKIFGTLGVNPEHREAMLALGCRLMGSGADQGLLKSAMQQLFTDIHAASARVPK